MTRPLSRRTALASLGGLAVAYGVGCGQAPTTTDDPQKQDVPSTDTQSSRSSPTITLSQESFSQYLTRGQIDTAKSLALCRSFGVNSIEFSSGLMRFQRNPEASLVETFNSDVVGAITAAAGDKKDRVSFKRLVISGEPALGTKAYAATRESYSIWTRLAVELDVEELAIHVDVDGTFEAFQEQVVHDLVTFCDQARERKKDLRILIENDFGITSNIQILADLIDMTRRRGDDRLGILLNITKLRYDPYKAVADARGRIDSVVLETQFLPGKGDKLIDRTAEYRKYLELVLQNSSAKNVTIRYVDTANMIEGVAASIQLVRESIAAVESQRTKKPTDKPPEKKSETQKKRKEDAKQEPPGDAKKSGVEPMPPNQPGPTATKEPSVTPDPVPSPMPMPSSTRPVPLPTGTKPPPSS